MFAAHYFDGQRAKSTPVQVDIANDVLRVHGLSAPLAVPVTAVELSEPLGRTRRSIALPGGARIELPAGANAPELAALAAQTNRLLAFVHALERRWRTALLALLLCAGVIALALHYGVPALAKVVAFHTPENLRVALGTRALASLDAAALAPSQLDAARAQEVRTLFARFAQNAGATGTLRLELRRGGRVGANALALPAGLVVVTDELIERAAHDEHLLAVFAHEAGHARARHALRSALQHSVVATIVLAFTGDTSTLASLAAAIPGAADSKQLLTQLRTRS